MTSTNNSITPLAQERIKGYMDCVLDAKYELRYLSGYGWAMVFEIDDDVEMRLIGDAAGLVRRRGTDLILDVSGKKRRLIVPFKKKAAA